ncbi:MAG: co-chaperone GroES [Pseudomonadota bacterium]|nr:co-chaperone GroES [Pseudomonadota bacterium]
MSTKLRPLYDRIVVKALTEDVKTAGGIIIPDSAKEKPTKGEVVAVGNGAITADGTTRAMELKVGDTVLYKKWGADEVKVDGEDLLVMREEDVIAVYA